MKHLKLITLLAVVGIAVAIAAALHTPAAKASCDISGDADTVAQPPHHEGYGTALLLSDLSDAEAIRRFAAEAAGQAHLNISVSPVCASRSLRQGHDLQAIKDATLTLADGNAPSVILLQLGCNDRADDLGTGSALLNAYEHSLFDYPTGTVCTLTGQMSRNKRIAISKPNVANDNLCGALYNIILDLRRRCADSRLFLVAPPASAPHAEALDTQLRLVAQMLCIPYVSDLGSDLASYAFVWDSTMPRPRLGNILILGDSYSEQRRWTDQFERIADVQLVNLGVSSATLRDRYAYTSSPYTDHPVKTDNKGNHNTLSSQLEKLKRLRSGRREQGEPTVGSAYRPDIILIEGGTNDLADSDATEARYAEASTQQDRTNFVGALRYLCTELHALYPEARIYVVTPGGLYFGHTDEPFAYIRKCEQIRQAARLLHLPTIDWDREGRLSFVFNNSAGTGTGSAARPFRYNAESLETRDLLHPNERGGRYFAEAVVKKLAPSGSPRGENRKKNQ